MGETRHRDSVRLSETGKKKFTEAKAAKRNFKGKVWSYLDIASEAGVAEKTVKRLFSAKEVVDYENAVAIAKALDIRDLAEWIEPKPSNSPDATPKTSIDWHIVCHEMLNDRQEKQKFRRQITGRGLGHEVNADVPLGLVKPQQMSQRGENFNPSAERGMLQYQLTEKEIDREYKHDEFFQQVIEKSDKNFTITGEPGAGKSTWLEQIAIYLDKSKKNLDFPICISLESLGGKSLEDYLLQNWLKEALRFMPALLKVTPALEEELIKLFKSGKVWLLLDGVDEMRVKGESPLQAIANQLTAWVAQAQVVLTCRLNLWEANPNALPNFDTYRTLPFKDEQVADFIQQWFTKAGKPELGEGLQDKLGESGRDRLRDLIKNPLRVAMLCKIWYLKPGDLPKTKAIFYQRYRDDFYQWKPHPEITDDLDKQEELHSAMGKLAREAIEKKLPLRKKFAHKIMGKSLFQLACDIGWLNLVYRDAETDEPVYAFFHLTFQEYFAACAIKNWDFFLNHVPNNPKQGTYRIFEPQWREVILLWLGRQDVERDQKEQFIQALIEFDDKIEHQFYWFRAYFLAAAGIAEFENCFRSEEIVLQIIKWNFGEFNSKKQQWQEFLEPIINKAREALYYTERTKTIKNLIFLINKITGLTCRIEAIYYLGEIARNNQYALAELIELMKNDSDKYTKNQAAKSLGRIAPGHPKAIAEVKLVIQKSQDESMRIQAAENLGHIDLGNPTAIATLVELIQKSQDESTKLQAVEALNEIDPSNSEVITVLLELIQNSANENIQKQALIILGKISENNLSIVNIIVEIIQNHQNDDFVRRQAADSLQAISQIPLKVKASLIKIIYDSQDEYIQRKIAYLLGEIGENNPNAVDALIKLIQNSQDKDTRMQAADSLGKIGKGNPKAIATLVELIRASQDEYSRWQAAARLWLIDENNPIVQETLVELAQNSQDDNTRWQAADSLWWIDENNPIALTALINLMLTSQDEYISFLSAKDLCYYQPTKWLAIITLLVLITKSINYYNYGDSIDILKRILEKKQMSHIVILLKYCLSDETIIYEYQRFEYCYDIIWHCAQNMPYPDFYDAWHNTIVNPHPEVA